MNTLVDVNVVFALLNEDHAHYPIALDWWRKREDASVGLCLPVHLGILRLLTNSRAMNDQPVSPEEALAAWDAFANDPRTYPLTVPELAHDNDFRRFIKGRQPTPNLWTDAWLAALASSLHISLTSFDTGFRSFQLAQFEQLG